MKPTIDQIRQLLALRRGGGPDADYWREFLVEFHHKRSEQAMGGSGGPGFLGRAAENFLEMGPLKWVYVALLGYAAATVVFLLVPREVVRDSTPVSPLNYQVIPAPGPPSMVKPSQL